MPSIVKIDVEDGLYFYAEVDESKSVSPIASPSQSSLLPEGAVPTGILEDAQKSAEVAKETVKAAVTYIKNAFSEFNHPDELELEFNLALKGKAGIPILVEQSAEAAFKIRVMWVKPKVEVK